MVENLDKLKVLLSYLNKDENSIEEMELVEQDGDILFIYNSQEKYEIYDQEELNQKIDDIIESVVEETQHQIDYMADLSDLVIDNWPYMSLKVNEALIYEDVGDNIDNFIGSGDHEKIDGYYIFDL